MIDTEENFRWNYIKGEYLVRWMDGNKIDWYVIQEPQGTKNTSISYTVTCPHISTLLKTKNIYLEFDDENGIGTLQYLAGQILAGTGWSIGRCPTFLEKDGVTEKVRSLKDNSKAGAYQLITKMCGLFNAYPSYNGDKTVDFFSLNDSDTEWEFVVGENLDSVSVKTDTNSIVTRLYVEGEYGDYGYVGIDDVEANTSGLSYILNFDYYKQLGMFTAEHQAILDQYIQDVQEIKGRITSAQTNLNTNINKVVSAVGYTPFIIYSLFSELSGDITITAQYEVNNPTETPTAGSDMIGIVNDQYYEHFQWAANGRILIPSKYLVQVDSIAEAAFGSGGVQAGLAKYQSYSSSIQAGIAEKAEYVVLFLERWAAATAEADIALARDGFIKAVIKYLGDRNALSRISSTILQTWQAELFPNANMDLADRPTASAEVMANSGWGADTGATTMHPLVITANPNGTAGAHTWMSSDYVGVMVTPIVVDNNGNVQEVLTYEGLNTYMHAVFAGAASVQDLLDLDDLGLIVEIDTDSYDAAGPRIRLEGKMDYLNLLQNAIYGLENTHGTYRYAIFFQRPPIGLIGVGETAIEAKQTQIDSWQRKIDLESNIDKILSYTTNILALQGEIAEVYEGQDAEVYEDPDPGLYYRMYHLVYDGIQVES